MCDEYEKEAMAALEEVDRREAEQETKEIESPYQFFIAVCCATHNVSKCQRCDNFQGGDCTFYRMAQTAMSERDEVAQA